MSSLARHAEHIAGTAGSADDQRVLTVWRATRAARVAAVAATANRDRMRREWRNIREPGPARERAFARKLRAEDFSRYRAALLTVRQLEKWHGFTPAMTVEDAMQELGGADGDA